jgi:hypothetical protein
MFQESRKDDLTTLRKQRYFMYLLTTMKVKFFAVYAMKAYKESRGIAALILNLGTRWR